MKKTTREKIKQEILDILKKEDSLSAPSLLLEINKKFPNKSLILTSKGVGSICGELVREGFLMKEWKIPNHENGFYSLTSVWLKKTENWIKNKFAFSLPETIVSMEIIKRGVILDGHTTITKEDNIIKAIITIHVSESVLGKKNIQQGIKLVLIHEFCHIISPFEPDSIMKKFFPIEFEIWSKAREALECGAEISLKQ